MGCAKCRVPVFGPQADQRLFKARFWALECEKLTCRMRSNISQPSAECARFFEIQK